MRHMLMIRNVGCEEELLLVVTSAVSDDGIRYLILQSPSACNTHVR